VLGKLQAPASSSACSSAATYRGEPAPVHTAAGHAVRPVCCAACKHACKRSLAGLHLHPGVAHPAHITRHTKRQPGTVGPCKARWPMGFEATLALPPQNRAQCSAAPTRATTPQRSTHRSWCPGTAWAPSGRCSRAGPVRRGRGDAGAESVRTALHGVSKGQAHMRCAHSPGPWRRAWWRLERFKKQFKSFGSKVRQTAL